MITIRHNDDLIISNGARIIAPRMFELDGYKFYMHLTDLNYGTLWCDIYIYLCSKDNKKILTYRGTYNVKATNKGMYITFRNKRIYLCD